METGVVAPDTSVGINGEDGGGKLGEKEEKKRNV